MPIFFQIKWSIFRTSLEYCLGQFSQVIVLFQLSRKSQNEKFLEFFQLFAVFIKIEKCRLFVSGLPQSVYKDLDHNTRSLFAPAQLVSFPLCLTKQSKLLKFRLVTLLLLKQLCPFLQLPLKFRQQSRCSAGNFRGSYLLSC